MISSKYSCTCIYAVICCQLPLQGQVQSPDAATIRTNASSISVITTYNNLHHRYSVSQETLQI